MSAPQPEPIPDPDFDELWTLLAKFSVIADRAKAAGFCCDVPISRREIDVLAMVDANPVPDAA